MRSVFAVLALALAGWACSQTTPFSYQHASAELEGYLAEPAGSGPAPAVIIVHDWDGPNEYEKSRAAQLAQLGYLALAVDVYGKGVRPTSVEARRAEVSKYYGDRALFRGRLQAAVEAIRNHPRSNGKVAALGYCFGGAGVLELARSGSDIVAAISFHGGLETPVPATEGQVQAKVMVFHAAQDPAVPREQLNAFLDEMRDAKVDYQLVVYNLNVHPFTAPGPMYDATADRRSWDLSTRFLAELLQG